MAYHMTDVHSRQWHSGAQDLNNVVGWRIENSEVVASRKAPRYVDPLIFETAAKFDYEVSLKPGVNRLYAAR
jgi:hypothetical protein